jgi:thiol-disulfide isomerase/thioredoxin
VILVALPFAVRAASAQAVEIQVADTNGRALSEAVVQLIALTSFTPVVVDTIRSQSGRIRVRVPTPFTTLKLYAVKVCAQGYAPQFVAAPFGRRDTLRVMVQLRALERDTVRAQEACAGTPDNVVRVHVTDTSTFVGLAAAGNLVSSALANGYQKLLKGRTQRDTIQARLYQARLLTELKHRIVNAKSGSDRARAAHALVSFAYRTQMMLDSSTRATLRAALPPTSKWWLTDPRLVGFGLTQMLFDSGMGGDLSDLKKSPAIRRQMQEFLGRMVNSLDEPEIRSEAQSQLVRLAYIEADTVRAQSLLNEMLVESPNYPFTKLLASRFAPNRPLREGAQMPAFDFAALPDTTSRITNLLIVGKFTLVDFWGTWCGPCMGAMPELHRVYKLYHDRGFEILSVAADETPERVARFRATKWPMPWLNAFAQYSEGVNDNPKLTALGIVTYPQTVLVDPQGKIVGLFGPKLEGLASTLDRVLIR